MKKMKQLLMIMVMIASMMMMTQAVFAEVSEVSVGSDVYTISPGEYKFFKINDTYGTNNITIATYSPGELELIWFGKNEIVDPITYEIRYNMDSAIKSCVDNAAAKTTRTHMGNVCLKSQQILSGWNYFAIRNNSKELCALLLFIKIGSVGADAPFDVSIVDDGNFVPAKTADCSNNASNAGYECKHNLSNKYYTKNEYGLYMETSSLEVPDTVDPDNHQELIERIALEPTYQRDGERVISCTGCTYKITERISRLAGAAIGTVLSVSGAKYKVISEGSVEYKAPEVKTKSTVIPATVTINDKQYSVTSIAANAFRNNKKLKKVTIPASVKMIGKNAFSGCKYLKNIQIKSPSLTNKSVGSKAFYAVHAKAVIKVPKSVKKAYTKMLKKKGLKGKTQRIK